MFQKLCAVSLLLAIRIVRPDEECFASLRPNILLGARVLVKQKRRLASALH